MFHVERPKFLEKRRSGMVEVPDPDNLIVYQGSPDASGHVHTVCNDEGHVVDGFVVARVAEMEGKRIVTFCNPMPVEDVAAICKAVSEAPKA